MAAGPSIVSSAWHRPSKSSRGSTELDSFAASLLGWAARHGRHDLPWQIEPSPYRVWISEIMLQQTQVTTVIPYFLRFIDRFPNIEALARADTDEVLALWSGLGYYARARNLHQAARQAVAENAGDLPNDPDALMRLPGIGRSTAAAILALSGGQRQAILDGNVKRVLARFHAIAGWPGRTAVLRELWSRAEEHTPETSVAAYTQAIMDLGATVCTRSNPRCAECPVAEGCLALERDLVDRLPAPKPKPQQARPSRSVTVLVVQNETGDTLLERRPSSGIWGGLFSFPELDAADSADEWCRRRLGASPVQAVSLALVEHSFTHFDLTIAPLQLRVASDAAIMDGDRCVWYKSAERLPGGIAAPIEKILRDVAQQEHVN